MPASLICRDRHPLTSRIYRGGCQAGLTQDKVLLGRPHLRQVGSAELTAAARARAASLAKDLEDR